MPAHIAEPVGEVIPPELPGMPSVEDLQLVIDALAPQRSGERARIVQVLGIIPAGDNVDMKRLMLQQGDRTICPPRGPTPPDISPIIRLVSAKVA